MKNDSTKEVLERVNRYLSLIRYEYSTQEKLSRLNLLSDYYASVEQLSSVEKLKSDIDCSESLSVDFSLPLKVRGVFLIEGKPKARYYRAEDLKMATENPINGSFPLMLDHKDTEVSMIVGKVTKIWYDDSIKGIRWKGHINDETHARNVMDGSIKEVSATIYSSAEYDEEVGVAWKDLVFKELSLVRDGAVEGNYIELDA